MDNRKLLYGVLASVIVAAVTLAIYATVDGFSGGDNDPDNPDGHHFLCQSCNKLFTLTTKEYAAFSKEHWGELPPCPHCQSKQIVRPDRCSRCDAPCVRDDEDRRAGQTLCPKCKGQ